MRSRSFLSSVSAAAALLLLSTTTLLSTTPSLVAADLTCTQLGADTFHVGSTLKFNWTDTQTVQIDTFSLNLYCAENETFLQTITTLNSTSPASYAWVVNSSISAFSSSCQYNQYHGAFDWTSTNPDTGAATKNSARCKVMLMIAGTASAPGSSGGSSDGGTFDDEPTPSSIVVSDKTKTIVIGVGCAVGVLVLAGVVGFYVIRYSNKRAAEEQMSKKLREPIQSGPLFAPIDRNNGGNGGAAGRRYNELSSVTTGSETMGHSPATTTRTTEMVQLNGVTPIGTPVMSSNSIALGSRSPTPIAAAHAKAAAAAAAAAAGGNGSSPSLLNPRSSITTPALAHHYSSGGERPSSLLTSPFVPADEASGRTSLFRQQQQQQHYQNEIQMQQQQHQIQQQLQQQQQQAAYSNGYY
ncbi:hypothetical protein K457DRAFT_123985 [Linnemannia elongata AG-77]|uniref:Mid2 domain-containing protein n=1 Tax=Linnemannia elongata AG-77 TaxID=1314771 RepID=A0A197K5J2_9FUNG|nr:hypothetical protein K457DRAFT_123985 [Linnemannia elongata AG-77]